MCVFCFAELSFDFLITSPTVVVELITRVQRTGYGEHGRARGPALDDGLECGVAWGVRLLAVVPIRLATATEAEVELAKFPSLASCT